MDAKRIRVLIVDDSAFQRDALAAIFATDPAIEVVGYAGNGREAVDKARTWNPDVITMDIQMPVMNGFLAIEQIMMQNPRPIIVTSAFDAATLAQALVIGAMDYVAMGKDLTLIADELIGKVKIAARITPIRRMARSSAQPICAVGPVQDCFKVIAIGVSTGGPSALMDLFSRLPVDFPVAILVAQHMLQGFIEGLIQHLQRRCAFNIEVATPGKVLRPGTALVVPDGCHLRLGIDHRVELVDHQSLPSHYVPSIDIMMQSTAQAFHGKAIGVLLTGMGNDGVIGMQAIKRAGGVTLAQDEATSVVYGMNRMAVELGIVDEVVPITRMADHLVRLCVGQALSV